MNPAELLPLVRHSDARGHLVSLTVGVEVPFAIRRLFYIFGNTAGLPRGGHAHASATQLLISVAGSCRATIEDASGIRTAVLDRPDIGVIVPPMTWIRLTDFTPDCVLLVICDQEYRGEAITDRAAYDEAIE